MLNKIWEQATSQRDIFFYVGEFNVTPTSQQWKSGCHTSIDEWMIPSDTQCIAENHIAIQGLEPFPPPKKKNK